MNAPTEPNNSVCDITRQHSAKALEVELSLQVDHVLRDYERCLGFTRKELNLSNDTASVYEKLDGQKRPAETAWNWMCDHVGVKITAIRGFLSSRQAVPAYKALGVDATTVEQAQVRAEQAAHFKHDLQEPFLRQGDVTLPLFDAVAQHILQTKSQNPDLQPADDSRLRMQAIAETGKIKVSLGAIASTLAQMEGLYRWQAQQLQQKAAALEPAKR